MVGGMISKSIKSKHEKQEFLTSFYQTNLEREKAGLLPLNLCIAKYQFDPGWARQDGACKGIIQAYINGSVVVFGIIDYSLKWGIFNAIGDFFMFLWSLRIPDILLLILFLGILVWILFLNKKVRGFPQKKINEILSDNKRLKALHKEIPEIEDEKRKK